MRLRPLAISWSIAWLAAVAPAGAGWQDLWWQDMRFDLEAARAVALETVASNPRSADAVAAAGWWFEHLDHLSTPEELLAAAPGERDPELGFYLGLIENRLDLEAPPGALPDAELSGAFGGFSTLDLERGVVPVDRDLPALGTPWRSAADPFRVRLRTLDGYLAPPRAMIADGVHLVAYDVVASSTASGWMVVEASGGFNLEVDGVEVDRRRACGRSDPETNWYRILLEPGGHRIRLEVGAIEQPRVRLTLLDDRGAPLGSVAAAGEVATSLAPSRVMPLEPPAAAALETLIEGGDAAADSLLLAAQIARGRGDPETATLHFEHARRLAPDDQAVALAYARHLFLEGGAGAAEPARRISQLLRDASGIPGAAIFEHAVAVHERREEDAERLLDGLMSEHGDDVRVLRLWVREAVERGWTREADESLARLEASLPGSLSVTGLRLEVLAELERWRERENLLRALASATPVETRWIGELASSCLVDEAVKATRALVNRLRDPDMDVQLIQLLLESSDMAAARIELARARERWGTLPALDELALMVAGGDDGELAEVLDGALRRNPSNVQLLALAWRLGDEPFFAPFRVDGPDFAVEHRDFGASSDAVLLLDQAVERIFPDGSSVYYYHGLTRANTPVGARRASRLQPLPDAHFLKLRIIKPDGTVVVPVDARPGVAEMVLSEVEPGDLVEEEYVARVGTTGSSRRGHLPPYLYRFADPDRAFGLSEYVLLVPPEIDLQVDGNFDGLVREERSWRGLRLLSWRAEEVPPVPLEPFSPPAQTLMPWLNYGFGVTWEDVGDTFRDRLLGVLRTSPELRRWSREQLVGETPRERVRSLVAGLVETLEAGNAEIAFDTAAADSFAVRRGNRLGVLAAVLAEAGWEVDLVLARPWTERGQRMTVPTLDAFPAALLRVEREGTELWLDMREEVRGVGHINPVLQGGDGLLLPLSRPQAPVTRIDRLPLFDNPDLIEEIVLRVAVDSDGDARIAFEMALRGSQAEQLEERLTTVPEDQVNMVYRQIAAAIFPGASTVVGAIDDSGNTSLLSLDLEVDGACDPLGGTLECRSLVLSNPLVPLFATLPQRTYPLVLRVPIERRTELEVTAPPGWRVEDRPPRRLETEWGSVAETLERSGRSWHSTLRVRLPRQTVATEDYGSFARFCRAVDELTSRPPVLEREPTPAF